MTTATEFDERDPSRSLPSATTHSAPWAPPEVAAVATVADGQPLPLVDARLDAESPESAAIRPLGFSIAPMGFTEKLDGAFAVFRSRIGLFLAIAFTFVAPFYVAGVITARMAGASFVQVWGTNLNQVGNTAPVNDAALWWAMLTSIIQSLPVMFVGVGVAHVIQQALVGHNVRYRAVVSFVVRRIPTILAVWTVTRLVIGAGTFACFLPGMALAFTFAQSAPVIAFESARKLKPMGRSWNLSSARVGSVFMVGLCSALLNGLIGLGFNGVVALAIQLISVSELPSWLWILPAVAGFCGAVVQAALTGCVASVLYIDCRSRVEGLDIQRSIIRAFGARR